MTQDYYRVLGVARDASTATIRSAYARLAKRHHPDTAEQAARLVGRFEEVQRAYRCLSDPSERAAHDRAVAERERAHLARQSRVQRRLRRYDRGRRERDPRARRRLDWRSLTMLAVGAAVIARLSLTLIG